jgi:hypothetical protein
LEETVAVTVTTPLLPPGAVTVTGGTVMNCVPIDVTVIRTDEITVKDSVTAIDEKIVVRTGTELMIVVGVPEIVVIDVDIDVTKDVRILMLVEMLMLTNVVVDIVTKVVV